MDLKIHANMHIYKHTLTHTHTHTHMYTRGKPQDPKGQCWDLPVCFRSTYMLWAGPSKGKPTCYRSSQLKLENTSTGGGGGGGMQGTNRPK